MADNVQYTAGANSTPPNATLAATDELSDGSHAGLAKLLVSADGDRTAIPATAADGLLVDISNASIPVTGGLTDAQLRATPVPVDVDAPLGQAAMAASIPVVVASNQSAIPVSGTVSTGGLTDAELRATPVPVSGTVTANAGTNLNTSLLALESGGNLAAAAASLSVLDDWDETNRAAVNLIAGQVGVQGASGTVSALTQRVVLATDVALPAGNNNIGDVDIASSVLPTGAATLAEQQTQTASLSVLDDWDETNRAAVNTIAGQVGVAGGTGTDSALTQRVSLATNVALPAGNNNIGDVDAIQSGTWTVQPGNTANTTAWLVKEQKSATGTQTQVADTASSTTILASNSARLGASIQNDSSAALYLKMGTTASLTDYAVRLVQYSYFEVPYGYTGRIDGIWATDPGDGAARVTEYT